ncbi:MAG: hypothetical protein M1374_03680 [Firmicutes bacterium]|jgi:hypothetical protein|nr:hypothetical protein [Bacillota bacterium]
MSSIWTPNGEHEIKRPQRHTSVNAQTSEEAGEQDASQTLSDLEKQIRSTPVQDIIANHCYGLFQLAAIHLSSVPPNMKDASLAIDAMTAVIQKLSGRLGEAEQSLHEALTQLQFAYVQISKNSDSDQQEKPNGD